jgi:nitroreductase/dihydropteridine reductase
MNFLESMEQRYTTKKYNASKKISHQQIEELKQILRLSPSSINSQPWKFTIVENDNLKIELSKVSWLNTSKVLDAHAVIVFSRIDSVSDFEAQINSALPEGAVGYYNEFIKSKPEAEIKSWFEKQVYLALGIFLSACANMGIDSTPMEGIEPEKYDLILNNDGYQTLAAVAIGYRDIKDSNQPKSKPKSRLDLNRIVECK